MDRRIEAALEALERSRDTKGCHRTYGEHEAAHGHPFVPAQPAWVQRAQAGTLPVKVNR